MQVAEPKDVERALATIKKTNKKLDVLVNSAGIVRPSGSDPDLETLAANATSEVKVCLHIMFISILFSMFLP